MTGLFNLIFFQPFIQPNDKIIVWGYDELVAAFIDYAISSRSRKTSVTLMVTGSSSCAKKYLEKFRKKIESQILQGMILRSFKFSEDRHNPRDA